MPNPRRGFLARLREKVFRSTGIHLNTLLKVGAVLLIAIVGISWTLLSAGAEQGTRTSNIEGAASKPMSNEDKLADISSMPGSFPKMQTVEKMGILNSKIATGEELVNSGSSQADQAVKMLVFLYGTRCTLEELQGLDSDKSYRRMAELRQQALVAGNEKVAAAVDFLRVIAATNRLKRRSEIADFRFASDAVLNLDSSNLKNVGEARKLFDDAISLHNSSSNQDKTAIFLSFLADTLIGSPESSILNLGLRMKDYPRFFEFYKAIDELPYSTHEDKIKFYKALFAEVQKSPPQSAVTYRVIVQLLDRLVNKSDLPTASLLARRLSEVAALASPGTKAKVEQSIKNIETRIAAIGKTIDLSGATYDGSPLETSDGKETTLLFWRPSDEQSVAHVRLLAEAEWFDPWETKVLLACQSPLSQEELLFAANKMPQFKVLDSETSLRIANDLGIDLVPYQVSLDKTGKVVRLGGATN